jgi:dihydrofolate reductase
MRKIILSLNITEDGFVAGPDGELDWHLPFWGSDMCDSLGQLLSTTDTILLGRNTYNALAAYWPNRAADLQLAREDIALTDMMNQHTKLVVSTTLTMLSWNNSFILKGNLKSEIKGLKSQQGGNIIVLGSCTLVASLIKHKLVDEYHLWVHPIRINRGKRLRNMEALKHLKPMNKQHFTTRVTKCVYVAHSA